MNTTTSSIDSRIAGAGAALASMGATELLANALRPNPGPVEAVSARVIGYAPTWFVELGKSLFGFSDKLALIIGTVILTLIIGTQLGRLARENLRWSILGVVGLQFVGYLAMVTDDNGSAGPSMFLFVVGCMVGIFALVVLMALVTPRTPLTDGQADMHDPTKPPVPRRTFLGAAGVIAAGGALMGVGATRLRSSGPVSDASLPPLPNSPQAEAIDALVAAANQSEVASTSGITPAVVSNENFYRIDTSLFIPTINAETWTLEIDGLVDTPRTYTYAELVERSTTVAPVTLSCVSNETGGPLVGNAVWQGVPLKDLLDEVGVQAGASQIASFADNWSCGFPTAAIDDERMALVATGMNGEPLPPRHGFPARLVVSGLYGYVSATKWLRRIELTTLDDFDGFWIDKGWSKIAPVKIQSRIDRPLPSESLDSATVDIAGVAWAPNVGIKSVEVQVDDGAWLDAELGESLGPDSWLQWRLRWKASSGDHTVRVRATDNEGKTQTEEIQPPRPDGATGLHSRRFSVS